MDGSVWWKKLIRICNGVGLEMGNWFEENLLRKVGNGAYTFFLGWIRGKGRLLCMSGLGGYMICLFIGGGPLQ